jgi:2,3-bisphosphoglycerate-dependent phosphoglycerate mutase
MGLVWVGGVELHTLVCMETTRILAIRHGETDWNVASRIQGQIDIELNPQGQWQAQQVARALAEEEIHAVYASDLSRAHATAQQIATLHGLPVQTTPALRERHYGVFESQIWDDIQQAHPQDAARWRDRDPLWTPANGGESLVMLQQRVRQVLHDIASEHRGQQIALVTHGGVLDIWYRLATGQDLQVARTWGLRNTAINRLLWTPQGVQLVGWADERHLDQGTREETSA